MVEFIMEIFQWVSSAILALGIIFIQLMLQSGQVLLVLVGVLVVVKTTRIVWHFSRLTDEEKVEYLQASL